MKNFKKFTAFVLTLCMLLSLSVAAFAAEPETHTVYVHPRFEKLHPPDKCIESNLSDR